MQKYQYDNEGFETKVRELCDPEKRERYQKRCDGYKPSFLPRLFGSFLVFCGNLVYGEAPSYLKFRAVEVIARVPYHSWESVAYTLLTLFYTDEKKALELSYRSKFSHLAQENETMHVVVISKLASKEHKNPHLFRHYIIPMLFSFFYFWVSYIMYLLKPKYSLELNYLFEQHAYEQYSRFLDENEDALREKKMSSKFLKHYGREPENQYEFFELVRNDELVHRNCSLDEINV